MSTTLEFIVRAVLIGSGATIVMDLWALFLAQLGIRSLNLAFLGRWVGHVPEGRWIHENIASAPPVRGELVIGWCAHYAIGISFAALLLATFGLGWARSPSLFPAILVGIATVVAPLFILQPGLGAGIASSKTATPLLNCLKSVVTHTVYGFGLYFAGRATAMLFAAGK
jgi:hypothetical protein